MIFRPKVPQLHTLPSPFFITRLSDESFDVVLDGHEVEDGLASRMLTRDGLDRVSGQCLVNVNVPAGVSSQSTV